MGDSMKSICGVLLLLAGSALGRANTYKFVISNAVSPNQPIAVIQVWAAFDPLQYAFHQAGFDVAAADDPGAFSDPERQLDWPGNDGEVTPDGDAITGVFVSQLHAPGEFFADMSNPLLIWQAAWTTSDFAPRSIQLGTATTEYSLYVDQFGTGQDFTDTVVEGAGLIQVVPAPASAAVLLAAPVLWRRKAR
jgi:hypothetical protein